MDVEHKKRGRPRIRPHETRQDVARASGRGQRPLIGPGAFTARPGPAVAPPFTGRPLASRGLELAPSRAVPPGLFESVTPGPLPTVPRPIEASTGFVPPPASSSAVHEPALAYLQMDLMLAKATEPFCYSLRANHAYFEGRPILDRVARSDWNKIQRLKSALQEEQEVRDPVYLPPIFGGTLAEDLLHVQDINLADLTQGSREHMEDLTFVLPDGQLKPMRTRFQLARMSVYFVIMLLMPEGSPRQPFSEFATPSQQPNFPGRPGAPLYGEPSRPGLSPGGLGEPAISSPYYMARPPGPVGRRPDQPPGPAEALGPHTPGLEAQRPGPPPTSEYPAELQLAPIRSPAQPSPGDARPVPKRPAPEGEGEEREEAEQGGRGRKRQRVSVEEILE